MEKRDIKNVLEKVNNGSFDANEETLAKWWLFRLNNEQRAFLSEAEFQEADDAIWSRLEPTLVKRKRSVMLWPSMMYTAVAALAIICFLFFIYNRKNEDSKSNFAQDIRPGKNGATLTLADGRRISLSDAKKGSLAEEAGMQIQKLADGTLAYTIGTQQPVKDKYNTLSTAPGQTYQVKLPDGSLVWLNAASSLTYAVSMVKDGKREVKLSGEGYFEVVKDKAHPFIVKTDHQHVQVLGTHFNINAYTDEPVTRTTLLEGSVTVTKNDNQSKLTLIPGEQAELAEQSGLQLRQVDAQDAVAWKMGYFKLNSTPLEDVMRQVSRWYDVEVIYENEKSRSMVFEGTVSRFDNVSRLLKTLENTGAVKFRIAGKKVYVRPY